MQLNILGKDTGQSFGVRQTQTSVLEVSNLKIFPAKVNVIEISRKDNEEKLNPYRDRALDFNYVIRCCVIFLAILMFHSSQMCVFCLSYF